MLYTKDSIERVKDAVEMVELVGTRTDLRRVGSRHVGLCPFHDERTPSFSVNAEHKLYHCFGCGASGDAIGFVRETEALDFREAVELLADRYGVELKREAEDPRAEERRRRRERLLSLLDRTARFYATYLWNSAEASRARDYLAGRGLGEELLREFRVGYSPSAWDRVVLGAQRDGFRPEEVAAAGLGQRGRRGGLYDRFRGRIMFPLAEARGRVLGFGARAVREDQPPKYLNTSENELYHKGRQLFGIDHARAPAARAGRIVVVEGYTDVLALHGAGIPESVAIMGTALTQEQLAELARAVGSAGTIYLALDADRSGQEAMLRAARGASDREVELRVVTLAEDKDPADLVAAEGAGAITAGLEGALSVPEFEVRRVLADGDLDTPAGRDRALERARPLIAATPARSASRDALVRYVADRLDLPVEYVTAQLAATTTSRRFNREGAGAAAPAVGTSEGQAATASRAGGTLARAERAFLAMCLAQRDAGLDYIRRLAEDHLSSPIMRRAAEHLERHYEDPLAVLPSDDPALSALITDISMLAEEEPTSEAALRMGFLQLELRRVERDLRRAAETGDRSLQQELAGARQSVRRDMDHVMGQTA